MQLLHGELNREPTPEIAGPETESTDRPRTRTQDLLFTIVQLH